MSIQKAGAALLAAIVPQVEASVSAPIEEGISSWFTTCTCDLQERIIIYHEQENMSTTTLRAPFWICWMFAMAIRYSNSYTEIRVSFIYAIVIVPVSSLYPSLTHFAHSTFFEMLRRSRPSRDRTGACASWRPSQWKHSYLEICVASRWKSRGGGDDAFCCHELAYHITTAAWDGRIHTPVRTSRIQVIHG